jgi:hypothetical protein
MKMKLMTKTDFLKLARKEIEKSLKTEKYKILLEPDGDKIGGMQIAKINKNIWCERYAIQYKPVVWEDLRDAEKNDKDEIIKLLKKAPQEELGVCFKIIERNDKKWIFLCESFGRKYLVINKENWRPRGNETHFWTDFPSEAGTKVYKLTEREAFFYKLKMG